MTCLHPFQCVSQRRRVVKQNKLALPMQKVALQSLSTEEKERIQGDLYGETNVDETPEFLRKKLKDLELELELLDGKIKRDYILAVRIEEQQIAGDGKEYITSQRFLVMFLRAESFNAKLAALRLALYFTEKRELFGDEALTRKIKQEDLSEEDKKALNAGAFLITDATDESGRIVAVVDHQKVLTLNPTNLRRAVFYLFMTAIEKSEVTQKKGIVAVDYNMYSRKRKFSNNNGLKFTDYRQHLHLVRLIVLKIPIRTAVVHACYNDLMNHVFLNFFTVILPMSLRPNVQCHYRKQHEEFLFDLLAYGINADVLPFSAQGEIQNDRLLSFLEKQRELEEEESEDD